MPEKSAKKNQNNAFDFPNQIRVSVGSAIVLGLLEGDLDAKPTTAYLMTYYSDKAALASVGTRFRVPVPALRPG